jgi:hypothetical protein
MKTRRERRPFAAQSRNPRIIDGTKKDETPMFLSRDEVIALCDQKDGSAKDRSSYKADRRVVHGRRDRNGIFS